MWAALNGVWRFRAEILLGIQVVGQLRKTARELAQEYIRKRIRAGLRRSLLTAGIQIALLAAVWVAQHHFDSLTTRLLASAALWGITLHNSVTLFGSTLPELRAVRRNLKSRSGYALKYLLQISIATELMQLNVIFLVVCLSVAVSSRTWLGASFSYLKPWLELWTRL